MANIERNLPQCNRLIALRNLGLTGFGLLMVEEIRQCHRRSVQMLVLLELAPQIPLLFPTQLCGHRS